MRNKFGTIGIVIPTYKRVGTLKYALESALAQTYSDIEVVVMDDANDMETSNYVMSLTDSRIKLITNSTNLGLARNINKGISKLSENVEWCTVLCDDDYYDKKCIEALVNTVVSKKAKTIVHSHIVFVDHDGQYLRDARIPPDEENALDFVKSRALFVKDRYLSGVMFSRRSFNEIGGYPVFQSGMAADDALIFSLSLRDRLIYSEASKVYIRIHENAESQQLIDIEKHMQALMQYRDYCIKDAKNFNNYTSEICYCLEKYLTVHVQNMNSNLWLRSVQFLNKIKTAKKYEKYVSLYALGINGKYLLSIRVRISSYSGLKFKVCLEKISVYRSIWRQIKKLHKIKDKIKIFRS